MNLFIADGRAGRGENQMKGSFQMADKTKHKVAFNAHRIVREEIPVKFKTRDGERVSFEAKKKVREPVKVKFMAKD
jgi:hypothetical protein